MFHFQTACLSPCKYSFHGIGWLLQGTLGCGYNTTQCNTMLNSTVHWLKYTDQTVKPRKTSYILSFKPNSQSRDAPVSYATKYQCHIPQYNGPIPHNALLWKKLCTYEHISVTKWCIVGYLSNALLDLWDWSTGELWGVYCEYLRNNQRTVYFSPHAPMKMHVAIPVHRILFVFTQQGETTG